MRKVLYLRVYYLKTPNSSIVILKIFHDLCHVSRETTEAEWCWLIFAKYNEVLNNSYGNSLLRESLSIKRRRGNQ